MTDLRHCDRRGCTAWSRGDQISSMKWRTVRRTVTCGSDAQRFCSAYCLAQWALDDLTGFEMSLSGVPSLTKAEQTLAEHRSHSLVRALLAVHQPAAEAAG